MIPDLDVQRQLQEELDSGEKIVWQGQPKPHLFAAKSVVPFLFSLVWLTLLVPMGLSAIKTPRGIQALPVFILFALVGLAMAGQPAYRYYSDRRTHYLLTNRRALIITLGRSKKVLSYYPDKLQALERRERADGSGDLIIDRRGDTGYRSGRQNFQEVGFINIPAVKTVEAMVRNLAAKSSPGNA